MGEHVGGALAVTATQPGRKARRKRPWLVEVYSTDVGKKYAMAISGVLGLLFLISHMVGNLHIFEGAIPINDYGEGLRDLGHPLFPRTLVLWLFLRVPLIIALVVHVHAAWALNRSNTLARGSDEYDANRNYLAANYASRTMGWTGIIVLLFLAWHLADLTIGIEVVNPDFFRGDVYSNVRASLERWPVFFLYVISMLALGLHIWHGAWSLFQTLGINNPRFNAFRRTFAWALASVVVVGFLTVPFGVQLGLIS